MSTKLRNTLRYLTLALLFLCVLFVMLPSAMAQENTWSEPINLSGTFNNSWFPDISVDNLGQIHVTWCETIGVSGAGHIEQVFYRTWDGFRWTASIDIIPSSPDIIRHAISADYIGRLHLLFGGSVTSLGHLTELHTSWPVKGEISAGALSEPVAISQRSSYMGDIAIDKENTIHVVFDQLVGTETEIGGDVVVTESSDIFYTRSTDGGDTWTSLVNLLPSPTTGSSRSQIEIDPKGTLHVTWDEGWDRLTGRGNARDSYYVFSVDNGETWSAPLSIYYPNTGTAQLTAGGDGAGGVILVWRTIRASQILYQWSNDSGQSWAEPRVIPDLFARPWVTDYDLYDMATDSSGRIHLLLVAQTSTDIEGFPSLYHLSWDGENWSEPAIIYGGWGYPEYPRLEVNEGNHLHAVWFIRDSLTAATTNYEVWYADVKVDAPYIESIPIPTPTLDVEESIAPTETAIPSVMPDSQPTRTPVSYEVEDVIIAENDMIILLIKGLSPAVLFLLGAVIVIQIKKR